SYYSTPTTETSTYAGTSLTVTQTGYYNITFNATNYGVAGAVLTSSNYYWVASRYARAFSSYALFGLRIADTDLDSNFLAHSNGDYSRNDSYRLRPVVSFASSLLDGTKDESGAWNLR
ncbi:MAG: hypothetical protein ACI4VQ_03645, partial [Clostridia bacterium]